MRATVRLAPGSGILARRGEALLYLPERDERLLEAFTNGPEGGELQALASATVAAGFEVAPYAAVGWGPTVRVMAFGAVAVETDQPSLPMLTGAGSRTWVEHSLTVDTTAVITVDDGEVTVDPATDLTAGVALTGAFRLELVVATAAPVVPAVDPTTAAVEIEPPEREPTEDEPAAEPEADPTTSVSRPPTPPPAPEIAGDDPAAALAAIQAAAMGADGRPVHEPSVDVEAPTPQSATASDDDYDDEPESLDDDITLPPPAPGELLDEVMRTGDTAAERSPERGSLVDAKLCPDGHPNPPVVASCAVCGQFLSPGTSAVVHVPRPSLGHLEFDDGSIAELDHELLVGRNPDRDSHPERAGLRPVKVLGDKVSRSHVEIRFQGWDVLVADCGSTNGTFVVPHPGGQVTALQAGRAQLLEPGATVYFGSRSFTVVGRDGT
jgi:FHA domain